MAVRQTPGIFAKCSGDDGSVRLTRVSMPSAAR